MKDIVAEQYERAEDFFVHATLNIQGRIIDNVPCKVFLPERVTKKPLLKFRPTEEQYTQITTSHEGSFEATVIGFDNKTEVSLACPNVYFSNMVTRHWGPDFSESTFDGEPQHLQVIRHLHGGNEPRNTSFTIRLTPNQMLSPAMGKTSHYTGNIEYTRAHQLTFSLSKDIAVTFDRYFKEEKLVEGEARQWSYLVACLKIDIPAKEVAAFQDKVLQYVDELLTIASLGSRTRTGWVGWQASDHEVITDFYRGNFVFPSGESEPSFNQGLVWLKDLHDFLSVCYPAFVKHPNKKAVRNAIMSVVPGRRKVMEDSFLSMFAGLEALLLDFRRRERLEFVVPEMSRWDTLKRTIKKSISKIIKADMTREQRCYIYNKLEELNRIPLQAAFNKFCETYDIDVSDLWPLFGKDNIIGLADIRNRLIHGDQTLFEFHDALWIAEENLRFMLERILVQILGWPVDKTEVSKGFLSAYSTALRDMAVEQLRISKYFADIGSDNGARQVEHVASVDASHH